MGEEKTLTIAALALALVAGAVLGRLHEGTATAIGDRVMCGLLSLPLITLSVHYAFSEHSLLWALVAPAPVLIYTVLLAITEENEGKKGMEGISPFTRTLLVAVGLTYAFMLLAVFAVLLYNWPTASHTKIPIVP